MPRYIRKLETVHTYASRAVYELEAVCAAVKRGAVLEEMPADCDYLMRRSLAIYLHQAARAAIESVEALDFGDGAKRDIEALDFEMQAKREIRAMLGGGDA
jgi:hypothetical protein